MKRRAASANGPKLGPKPTAGPKARPFHRQLRALLDELGLPISAAAELLSVKTSTLSAWMAAPDDDKHREPHRLVRIGALNVLNSRVASVRQGKSQVVWRVWREGDQPREAAYTNVLRRFIHENHDGPNAATVASRLYKHGLCHESGWRAERVMKQRRGNVPQTDTGIPDQ